MSDDVKHHEDDHASDQAGTRVDDVKHGGEETPVDQTGVANPSEPTPAQKALDEQKQGLIRKIKAGDLTLDQVKSNKELSWIAPLLEKDLGPSVVMDEATFRRIASEEAERIAKAKEDELELKQLDSVLGSLSSAQRKAIEADAELYTSKLGKLEAMKIAFRANGVRPDATTVNRIAMSVPTNVAPLPREKDDTQMLKNQYDLSKEELHKLAARRRQIH